MTVEQTVAALNRAWREERYDELAGYFHPQAVIVAPGFAAQVEGREACVRSYRDFATAAVIQEFTSEPPQVGVWGSTAVAICPFTIVYELADTTYRERGVDLFVLSREAGSWLVVFRAMTTLESTEAPAGS